MSDFNDICKKKSPRYASEANIKSKITASSGIECCISGGAGSIANKKEACMFHYALPDEIEINEIYNDIKSLEKNKIKPDVFIVGGISGRPTSEDNFNNIMEKLKEFKKNITILWGQKDDGLTNLFYSAPENTLLVSRNRGLEIKSLADIKKIYRIAQFCESDEIVFKTDAKMQNSIIYKLCRFVARFRHK